MGWLSKTGHGKGEVMSTADAKNLDYVREVLQRNKKELMQRYKSEGVGIGKQNLKDDSYVVTVFMATLENIPTEPVEVEGIPLQFEVTGKFKAQL
jgi:hypothetical protein